MYPVVADGGEMTVLRSLASDVYGKYDVAWPDNVPEEIRPKLPDDRAFGYASRLGEDRGRMGRRFIRTDISVQAAEYGPNGMLPYTGYSDVEATLDAAAKKTSGDVFFGREFTREHLGSLEPWVDFKVGDKIPVEIWGKLLEPTVVSIEAVTDHGAVIDWRVRAGDTLLKDDEARERTLRDLERDMAQEIRERQGDVAKVRETASAAKRDADSAKETADGALKRVESAEGIIRRSLAASVAAEAQGHAFAQEAYESYEKARGSYQDALQAVAEVNRLVDESDAILDKNESLFENVDVLHGQVQELHRQMQVASMQFRGLLGSAAAHSAQSAVHEQQALVHVERAEEIRAQIGPLVEEAQRAIDEGKQHVENAFSYSEDARGAVSQAQGYAKTAKDKADEAIQALKDASGIKRDADAAAQKAGEKLEELNVLAEEAGETLSKIDAAQNKVLKLHNTVIKKHGEVMNAHETAIKAVAQGVKAAGAAAGSASMGAMYAQLTAEDAARAADSALDASAANKKSIKLLEEVQGEHSSALRELGEASKKLRKSTDDLIEAGKVQDRINNDLKEAQSTLEQAQKDLKTISENLQRSDRIQNQAIRAAGAAAGFAAQTGMHAADTAERATRTAESALEAHAHLQEVVEIHGDVVTKASQTATDAKSVADAAGKTAADAKKASDAVAEAARAREETLAVQQFYTGEQALLTQGMVYWTREQRTRVYDHAGTGTKTHEGGLLKTWDYNSQRGLSFQAFGNWWGKVTFQVEFKGGSDSAVDLHTYNVAYDKRSDTFKQGAIHMAFMNAHMQVEVWKPNNAVFYLPVDTKTGKVTSVSAYETPIGNPFLLHSDGSFSVSGIKANIFDVSTKTVNGMERLYPKKRTIPGTKISVWPAFIEVREVA